MKRKEETADILIIGGGAAGLFAAGWAAKSGLRVLVLEAEHPAAIRRQVSLCEAVYEGETTVEGLRAVRVASLAEADAVWAQNAVPVLVDPKGSCLAAAKPAEEPAKKKMTYGERLELERLDQEIARSEAELKMLGAEINQCGSDFTRLADLTKQQEAVQQKLDEMVDRWAYLSELAEAEG